MLNSLNQPPSTKHYLTNQVTYRCVATKSHNGARKRMNSLDKCYKTLQQNGKGLRAIELAKELKLNKSTIHRNLNTLQLRGKVEERNGIWYAIENSQTQNLNPIKTILDELENLTLKQAKLKSRMIFIDNYNPENIDPEIEITELRIKIEELEKLKNRLITQLKLATTTDK
jgi:DNA-binding transcriptional MocR family regulator